MKTNFDHHLPSLNHEAFHNSSIEKQMFSHLKEGKHLAIIGPENYDKTTFLRRFLFKHNLNGITINLTLCNSEDDILSCIIARIKTFFISYTKKTKNKKNLMDIDLIPAFALENQQTCEKTIQDILSLLSDKFNKLGIRVVIILEGFHNVLICKTHLAIMEGFSLAAKNSSVLSFIFLCDSQEIYASLFNQEMPMFNLCNPITLNPISLEELSDFFDEQSTLTRNKKLDDDVIETMMMLTQGVPFYVNQLYKIISANRTIPDKKKILSYWEKIYDQEKYRLKQIIRQLTNAQIKILNGLARGQTEEPCGYKFSIKVNLATSTIHQAINVLIKKGLVYVTVDKNTKIRIYNVQDPMMRYLFLQNN